MWLMGDFGNPALERGIDIWDFQAKGAIPLKGAKDSKL